LERSPGDRFGPSVIGPSPRLRVSTMTPAIVPFNRRRKYQVHSGTAASGPRVVGRPRLRSYDMRVDRLAGIERTAASADVCAHSSAPGARSLRKMGREPDDRGPFRVTGGSEIPGRASASARCLGPSSGCERFRPLPMRKRPPVRAGWLWITAAIWSPKDRAGPLRSQESWGRKMQPTRSSRISTP
jgi:hypothetical protein